eukprot:CAMPEP_0201534978 /NCGR_PEP_ID=MMETSP0161_2-20130828/57654_1 /ASSEMBLY_ACC=CAM_ASM_000251 /TAXON_ID=180227 /ORGANISM="Neoparamoeba aestuarina, Strain SoJaBio B1-5/56/2" /LENGTH=225 /DNA_ID=CAMNT_0047939897 /DNA_START=72 /DNA_END=749 /DNA_ORIENTATION=+
MPAWKELLAEPEKPKHIKEESEDDSEEEKNEKKIEKKIEQKTEKKIEKKIEENREVEEAEDSDDEAPEAVSLSVGKERALDLRKKETQSQTAYKQEQKERARKLFHSDNVRSDKKKDEISFLDTSVLEEIEEDESKKETELQKKKEEREEKRKRKREEREALEAANKPKRKKFSGGLEVVLSSEGGQRKINNKARAKVNCHFRHINRKSSLSCHSNHRGPSSSFV